MLRPFKILIPTNVSEATQELKRLGERARIYAGGAEILLLMRHGLLEADYLINIKPIEELNRIIWDGRVLSIGATVTHHRLEGDPQVRRYLPMFAQAESQVANIRVRNQGTLGGNLCFSDPHSDPGTALLVYEAQVTIGGSNGQRKLPLEGFFLGMYSTALEPDELLLHVEVPVLPSGWGSSYLRVHRYQRPTLGVAAAARVENGRIEDLRLAAGCVGPKPERLRELEAKLRGIDVKEAEKIIFESKSYLEELLEPIDDLLGSAEYKLYMTRVLLQRALEEAGQGNGRYKDESGRLRPEAQPEGMKDEGGRMKEILRPTSQEEDTLQAFEVSLTINGQLWQGAVPVEETLLEFVRNRLGLTGTKRSCESEVCGACTVLINNEPVSSCNYLAFEARGKSVLTIEGLARGEELDPIQEAFIRNVGAQCGYCTPGQIMAAKALLLENPSPKRAEIAEWLSGNICRCGAYPAIAMSIMEAAQEGQKR